MNYKVAMVILGWVVVIVTGCAASPSLEQGALVGDPKQWVAALDADLIAAQEDEADVLAPDQFKQAQKSYEKARRALEKNAQPSIISDHVAQSRAYLEQALAIVEQVRHILKQTNDAREKAIAAGARDLGQPFEEVEARYTKLLSAIKDNEIEYAQENAEKVQMGFHAVEIMAIKHKALDPVRRLMAQAQQQGIDRVTPQTYGQAVDRLNKADQFIDQNPYAKQAIEDHAAQALFMAQRMMAVADGCKRFQAMSPEESALFVEAQFSIIGRAMGAGDVRNLDLLDQASALAGDAQKLLDSSRASAELNQSYQAQIAAMEQRIAGLQGFSRQQEAEKARLAAEREFNERFDQVQRYFTANEAEVYKQGNQLVIRMRGIKFPVGQATLTPENYQLLSKVQRAIRTFSPSSILIEGHTDSTGSAELNQTLSRARAEAVKAYLSANDPELTDHIKAVGYGSDRPLASNNTAEGRAVNRRIDVRITPEHVR